MYELECDELESTLLKTLDDLSDETPLDTIGLKEMMSIQIPPNSPWITHLDHDISTLCVRHGW
jgi:hypothetical protein